MSAGEREGGGGLQPGPGRPPSPEKDNTRGCLQAVLKRLPRPGVLLKGRTHLEEPPLSSGKRSLPGVTPFNFPHLVSSPFPWLEPGPCGYFHWSVCGESGHSASKSIRVGGQESMASQTVPQRAPKSVS